MKRVVVLAFLTCLAGAAFGLPSAPKPMVSDLGRVEADPVVSLDLGEGESAVVFIASAAAVGKDLAVLAPNESRRRVLAFIVNGGGVEAAGGSEALAAAAAAAIGRAGIRRVVVVGCGDCVPAALALSERCPESQGLVVIGHPSTQPIALKQGAYFALGINAEFDGLVGSLLKARPLRLGGRQVR